MKSPLVSARALLQSAGPVILALALPLAALRASEPSDADAQRQQAVSQYVDGASRELEAFRQQISAAARPDNQQLRKEANAKLDACKALVENLKTADQAHFDLVKSDYERSRAELEKAVRAFRAT
jgi:hypothetical protein